MKPSYLPWAKKRQFVSIDFHPGSTTEIRISKLAYAIIFFIPNHHSMKPVERDEIKCKQSRLPSVVAPQASICKPTGRLLGARGATTVGRHK